MAIESLYEEIEEQSFAPLPDDLNGFRMMFKLPGLYLRKSAKNYEEKRQRLDERCDALCQCLNVVGSANHVVKGKDDEYIQFDIILPKNSTSRLPEKFKTVNGLNTSGALSFNNLAHCFEEDKAIYEMKGFFVDISDWDGWVRKAVATEQDFRRLERLSKMCNGNAILMAAMLEKPVEIKERVPTLDLVPGLIARGQATLLAGRRKDGKSTLLRSLCVAVARGEKEWLGVPLNTIDGQIAIYLYGEGSMEENDNAILKLCGGEWPDGLVAERADGRSLEDYLEKCENYNVGLIVIDPDRTVYEGSESVSEVASPFYMTFERFLLRKNCAGINAHHLVDKAEPKNLTDVAKAIRGSGVWQDRPRCTLALVRMPNLNKAIFGIPTLGGIPQHNLGVRAYKGILELGWDDDRECHILKQRNEDKAIDFNEAELDLIRQAVNNWIDDGKRVTRVGKSDGVFESKMPELEGMHRAFVRAAIDRLIADGELTVAPDGALRRP